MISHKDTHTKKALKVIERWTQSLLIKDYTVVKSFNIQMEYVNDNEQKS